MLRFVLVVYLVILEPLVTVLEFIDSFFISFKENWINEETWLSCTYLLKRDYCLS